MPTAATASSHDISFSPWEPQPGPQAALIDCPYHEIFFAGARGAGKTSGLLGHWLHHQRTYGRHARGLFYRRTFVEMDEVLRQARDMFIPEGAVYIKGERVWKFPSGAELTLRHLETLDDAGRLQGQSYTWLGNDEVTHYPDPEPIDRMRATLRSVHAVPCYMVLAANPGGVGHGWIKDRFIDPAPPFTPIVREHGTSIFIPGRVWDNRILLDADPGYISRLRQSGPPWLVEAWLNGSWNISPGAYFEGVWDADRHVIAPIEIEPWWQSWRSCDWGYAAPYAVGWYSMDPDGIIYMTRELYGWGGAANKGTREEAAQVARLVTEAEEGDKLRGFKFKYNPADSSMWSKDGRHKSINDMFLENGVIWTKSEKGPGSIQRGLQLIVNALREDRLFVFENCRHMIRTLPMLPADEKNAEVTDPRAENHHQDQLMYSLRSRQAPTGDGPPKRRPKRGTFDWVIDKRTYQPAAAFPGVHTNG